MKKHHQYEMSGKRSSRVKLKRHLYVVVSIYSCYSTILRFIVNYLYVSIYRVACSRVFVGFAERPLYPHVIHIRIARGDESCKRNSRVYHPVVEFGQLNDTRTRLRTCLQPIFVSFISHPSFFPTTKIYTNN